MDQAACSNEGVRERSGCFRSRSRVTALLYLLMRDEIPCGLLEELVTKVCEHEEDYITFTNGWLAQYAHDLEQRLHGTYEQVDKENLISCKEKIEDDGAT